MKPLDAATEYSRRGWPVFPLHWPASGRCTCGKADCDSPGKHPLTKRGVHGATLDEKIIKIWWGKYPDANIAIACGEQSFDVLDIDVKHGIDGKETLIDLEKKHGRVPDTVCQITGSGGVQIMFEHQDGLKNAVNFAPGLDVRTTGGYVVAPPSLHVSGRNYEWELSSHPDETSLAPWPAWLFKLIQASNGAAGEANPPNWHIDLLQGVPNGQRNQTAARLAGLYLHRNLTPDEVLCLLTGWNTRNTPPLADSELKHTIKSIVATDQKNNNTGELDGPGITYRFVE